MWRCILVILISLGTVCSENPGDPKVQTEFGMHKGIWSETVRRQRVANFLGIPYAKPPIGILRLKKPEPWTEKWRRLRDSTKYPAPCLSTVGATYPNLAGKEDCLYLNVFTRQIKQNSIRKKTEGGRAVLVFLIGSELVQNDNALYDPYYLLDQDIVLVTVNYRYGLLGFFTTGDDAAPGNYGLKDVLEALKWIQRNIAAFGGDPNSVTLMGQGIGAGIVHLLALSDKSEGLFHRYVTHSGVAHAIPHTYRPLELIKPVSLHFTSDANCNRSTSKETVECLRGAIPVLLANRKGGNPDVLHSYWKYFGPTDEPESEEAVITENPKKLIMDGKMRDIPWLTGVVADEAIMMTAATNSSMCDEMTGHFEEFVNDLTNYGADITDRPAYVQDLAMFYFDGNFTDDCLDSLAEMAGDMMVNWPVYETVTSQASQMKSDVYFYNFAYRGTFTMTFKLDDSKRYGVAHGDDINYFFPVLNNIFEDWQLRNTGNDELIINIVTEMWANFAKTGVPRAKWTPDWEPFQKEEGYMEFGEKAQISMKTDFLHDRMVFWHNLTEKQAPQDLRTPNDAARGEAASAWADMRNSHTFQNLASLLALLFISAILAR